VPPRVLREVRLADVEALLAAGAIGVAFTFRARTAIG
jgi:hypothetical protein